MDLPEIDVLIVEDDEDMAELLLRKLQGVVSGDSIQYAGNFKEAQNEIKRLVTQGVRELILVLDGQFPYSEAEPKPHYMWRELLELIMKEFGPELLLYLIPFSGDVDTHHYMHDENQDNPRIKVVTGKELKNSDRVNEAIEGIISNRG